MAGAKDRDDGETQAIIFDGASVTQLARMFRQDPRDIARKIRSLRPVGKRRGFDIYSVKEAAEYLVTPKVDNIESYIARMSFKDLPPTLNKEMWNGLRARLRFEAEQDLLWPVEKVHEMTGRAFKALRMALLLIPDTVARETTLTSAQRARIVQLVDNALAELRSNLHDEFANAPPMTPGIAEYESADSASESEEEFDL